MNGTLRFFQRMVLVAILLAAFFLPVAEAEEDCLHYEPVKVTLEGIMKEEVHPGPPNYERVEEGDQPETFWFLYLHAPICVFPDVNEPINSEFEGDVTKVHIVIFEHSLYRTKKHLLDHEIKIVGTLYHAHTIHHRTKVLITAEEIEPSQKIPSPSHKKRKTAG